MNRQDAITVLRQHADALRRRGVRHAALFGPRARGDERSDSDVDILLEFDPSARVTIFDYGGLKSYIAALSTARWTRSTATLSKLICAKYRCRMRSMRSDSARAVLHDFLHQVR